MTSGTPNMIPQKKVAKTTKAEGKGTPEKQGKGSGVLESPEKTSKKRLLEVKRQNMRMGVKLVGTLKMCLGFSLMLPPC